MVRPFSAASFPSWRQSFLAWTGAALLAAVAAGAALAQATQEQGRIVVSGEGAVTAVPDMATISLGVSHSAETAQEAVAGMSAAGSSVFDALEAAGVEAADMQTSGLRLAPRFGRRDSAQAGEIVGYVAETSVTVRLTDIDRVGAVLDAVVAAGGNLFRGLSFGITDRQPLVEDAQRRAVADGARQAALLAEAAGVALGPLLRIETDYATPRPQMMRADMAMAEAAPMPVAEGELSLQARVRMVYEIAAP